MPLYVVGTPIGNLKDLSLRAIETLQQVDVIACEDTRTTRVLLNRYDISTPTLSYHEHNEAARSAELLERLRANQGVAIVSDAGTPTISDPGFRLISAAAAEGIPVVTIPGPSAPIAALAASGLPTDRFFFAGFLPSRGGPRRKALRGLAGLDCTLIFFESPLRLPGTLQDIAHELGADRAVVVGRELTKLHEEFLRGSAGELAATAKPTRGEITLLVGPPAQTAQAMPSQRSLVKEYSDLLASGLERTKALRVLSDRYGLPRREIYALVVVKRKLPPRVMPET
ncbi:MAG: 16S rRNA (cytidine(1402)-2'-O)-methyltransferase [Acidobacteriota bacterium]